MSASTETTKKYFLTVGIEVHAELKTNSKMFCGCKNDPHASAPNQNICPVCLAHPGTLPVVNEEAVRKLIMVGQAVGGSIASFTEFDRKNYFYPDIPKAYQLSQYQYPFVSGGELNGVQLTRIHLEEDTARSQHDQGVGSVVDFNRAGVPLMELVTEPVVHDAETASAFTRELQLLLRTIGASDANMEKGEMRVEANVSLSADKNTLGTKVEVKNINSHKAMEQAITYEVRRQAEVLDAGETITQETRGWDENRSRTFTQRSKEGAADYRYFPDPDIPKMDISQHKLFESSRISEMMPDLPTKIRTFYADLGIPRDQVELLVADFQLNTFFKAAMACPEWENAFAKPTANYLTSDIRSLLTETPELTLQEADPRMFVKLIQLVTAGSINSRVAKDLLLEVLQVGIDPEQEAESRGLLQKNSAEDLLPMIEEIIAANDAVVADIKAGNEKALKFLVGQGMKASKGSANPQVLEELLKEKIG